MLPLARTVFVAALCLIVPPVPAADDTASTALTPDAARADFELAVAVAETALPNPYWFQTRRAWRTAKAHARQALRDVRDGEALFRVLRPLLSGIGEGHLTLRRSDAMRQRDRAATGLVPVDVHWTEAGAFVTAGYGEATDIARGTRLVAIDGEPVDRLVDELAAALGHDGQIRTGAMREAEGRGYATVRRWMRGPQAAYRLTLRNPQGETIERTVAAVDASARPSRTDAQASPLARLHWLDATTAVLSVPTFSNRRYREAGSDFRRHLQAQFDVLAQRGAQRLILDLRDNGGGSEPNESILYSYLVATPLRRYAAVETRGAALAVKHGGRRYAVTVFDDEERHRQQRLPNGRLVRRNAAPEGLMSHWQLVAPVFDGRLVVLAGGATFSGGAELASMLYRSRRAMFVGEEVGGTYAGNTSGYRWEVTLPHSGMVLHVPLLQFRTGWTDVPHGRGVMPLCAVMPPMPGDDARHDAAVETAVRLFDQDWNAGTPLRCR